MRQMYMIRYSGEPEPAPGIPTPIPGLALVDLTALGDADGYSLTHVRSGNAVLYAPSPEALAQAFPLLSAIDWTRSGDEVVDDPDAVAAYYYAKELPGVSTFSGRSMDRSDILQ